MSNRTIVLVSWAASGTLATLMLGFYVFLAYSLVMLIGRL